MRGGGLFALESTSGLPLAGTTDTQTENMKLFEWRAVSECTVLMFSGWVVATRRSTRNDALANLSLS